MSRTQRIRVIFSAVGLSVGTLLMSALTVLAGNGMGPFPR